MVNRPLYVRKFHSSRLKEFKYNINNTFNESKANNEIISLAESQILRTLNDIEKRVIDREKLEILIKTRDKYKYALTYQQKKKNKIAPKIKRKLLFLNTRQKFRSYSPTLRKLYNRLYEKYVTIPYNANEYKRIQDKINRMMFNKDYVTVVMDNKQQYKHLYENGFYINGEKYSRMSCGAGQARVSTVVFGRDKILPQLEKRLNNGRNEKKKFSPSKFNAYYGLYSSATKIVSEPKFIVVKDYENVTSFMCNYVTENGWKVDDTITVKELKNTPMNRTDGMGLISYKQALKWSQELGLDYVPSQFCVRQSFIKGMLCVFPIHEFCEEKNNGNYLVDTIYTDKNGNPIKADLRDYDVIISESQFKLWDSFD